MVKHLLLHMVNIVVGKGIIKPNNHRNRNKVRKASNIIQTMENILKDKEDKWTKRNRNKRSRRNKENMINTEEKGNSIFT